MSEARFVLTRDVITSHVPYCGKPLQLSGFMTWSLPGKRPGKRKAHFSRDPFCARRSSGQARALFCAGSSSGRDHPRPACEVDPGGKLIVSARLLAAPHALGPGFVGAAEILGAKNFPGSADVRNGPAALIRDGRGRSALARTMPRRGTQARRWRVYFWRVISARGRPGPAPALTGAARSRLPLFAWRCVAVTDSCRSIAA
jgi:hypothetical protein